jgi:hypothetical protein
MGASSLGQGERMKGNDLQLYFSGQNMLAGSLTILSLQFEDLPKRLKIQMQFLPWGDTLGKATFHWVWLTAEVSNMKSDPQSFGRMLIGSDQLPRVHPPQNSRVEWGWRLSPEDLEDIENARADNPRAPLNFKLQAKGILQGLTDSESAAAMVSGEGNFEVPVSEWEDYLEKFGYNLPPSAAQLAGYGAMLHPSWADASRRLATARKHLLAGDDHIALIACLHAFEAVASPAYKPQSWFDLAKPSMPDQKASAVAGLFSKHCDYLNRVGHHRARKPPPDDPDLPEMPLNHWEAELMVASSQYLLAYALRLRG